MQKTIVFLVSVILLVGLVSIGFASTYTPYALNEDDAQPIIMTPFYTYTDRITVNLSFSGDKAVCSGSVYPEGTYSASVTVTLYKKNGSSWTYVNSWSDSATGGNEAYACGSSTVSSGTYKVTASGHVGGGKEYPSKSVTKTK